jgi:hypothetical protein
MKHIAKYVQSCRSAMPHVKYSAVVSHLVLRNVSGVAKPVQHAVSVVPHPKYVPLRFKYRATRQGIISTVQ